MAICLFSYLGVETAAVAAAKVRDPERNVPKVDHLRNPGERRRLSALHGRRLRHPARQRAGLDANKASYSVGRRTRSSGGSWAGDLVALAVIVSGIGALNGWTMICAEMPLAAAKDGLFPQRFGDSVSSGVPAFGIVASTVLASVAVVISYLGTNGATVFTTLVLMTGITAAVPYGFSALAQIVWRLHDRRAGQTPSVRPRPRRGRCRPGLSRSPSSTTPATPVPLLVRRLGPVPDDGRSLSPSASRSSCQCAAQ